MKVTIDSSEPLEGALRLVGALYDVTLVVAEGAAADASGPATENAAGPDSDGVADAGSNGRRSGSAARSSSRGGRRSGRTARKRPAAGGSSELRSWARANGYQVSDRGRVPSAVQSAFDEAHAG